jgi:hypothetical protein
MMMMGHWLICLNVSRSGKGGGEAEGGRPGACDQLALMGQEETRRYEMSHFWDLEN